MVAAVVPAVVGGLLGALTSNLAAVVIKLTGNSYNLWSDFDNDIESIRSNLEMIAGAEEEQLSGKDDPSIVMRISMEQMHELAFEIEDLLDRIQRRVVERERDGGPLHAVLRFPKEVILEKDVKKLKGRLKAAYSLKSDFNVVNGRQSSSFRTLPANIYRTEIRSPVGIEESMQEIRDWVMKDVEGKPEQLGVISIVGFSGSGKTTLANAVYKSFNVTRQFPGLAQALVLASKHGGDIKELLKDLLVQLGQQQQISDSRDEEPQLKEKISNYLKQTERYLIVLDDIKEQSWWDGIKSAFPEKAAGRIIVTTTIQSIARVCSRGDGYVHNMAALDGMHSKKLIKAILTVNAPSPGLEGNSQLSLINQCDGHPHALVSAANYLQKHHVVTEKDCEDLSRDIGSLMATNNALQELQNVLMNTYRSLHKKSPNLKTCLLYLCVFPKRRNIRGSRLMRRCLAEGYWQNDCDMKVADELGDQSVIWPMDTYKNEKVKTWRAHGIFHEFLLQMSRSAKFIESLENEKRRNYRHLFLFSGKASLGAKCGDGEKKPRAHSLTIYGSAGEAVGYFAKCQLLRVLDLEECNDLKDEHLDGIHELWHLKYLSVGAGDNNHGISRLPKGIEKLYCLETLDMRKTKKQITLPVEVLKLPHIAHLLGRFKLHNKQDWDRSKPEQYLPETSNLQTLTGFVADSDPGFQMLMDHMKQLRKVKIWLNSTSEDPDLQASITNFVEAELDTAAAVRSLSLDIGNCSGTILLYLAGGILRSLKLHGKLSGLVHYLTCLSYIRDLCLSSTNGLTEDDLTLLCKIEMLEDLKLVEVSLGGLVIKSGDFKKLLRLCLVQCPSLPTITKGALPILLSLRLLNQGLHGLSGIDIECHEVLQEVALDSEVSQETRKEWEDAAKKHPKRPKVLFFKRLDPEETGSMVKYVVPTAPDLEKESSMVGRERDTNGVGPDSCDASAAASEVPTDRDDGMSSSSSI